MAIQDPDDDPGDSVADPARERHDHSSRVHVQPDELQQNGNHREPGQHRRRQRRGVAAVPGDDLRSTRLRAKIRGLDVREDQPDGRREPEREADLPEHGVREPGEHQAGQSRTPQSAALAPDHATESVHRRTVHGEPGGLPPGVDRGSREGDHAAGPRPAGRPGVLREQRRRSVPEPDRGAAGLRCHDRSRRRHVHQQSGCHELDVQDGPRRACRQLRTDVPRGPLLGAYHGREPLQEQQAHDAHRIHRPERGRAAPDHQDRCHRPRAKKVAHKHKHTKKATRRKRRAKK